MVQTRAGAKNSEWLQFMRECAVAYRKRKEAPPPKSGEPKEEPPVTAPRRRKRDDRPVEEPRGS